MGLQEQLNAKIVECQDKEIEIERLKTTCYSLNKRVAITEQLQDEIDVLNKRLEESSHALQAKQQEVDHLGKSVSLL